MGSTPCSASSILAVLGIGHAARGSQRAIELPFFSFQASELGKVLLVLALSAFVVDRSRRLRERNMTIRVMLAALVPAMFVIAQPDLGSGMAYVMIALTLLFVAGAPWRHIAALVALGGVDHLRFAAAPAAGVHLLKPYQTERLTAFLHPTTNSHKKGYQQEESKIAIGCRAEDRPRPKRHKDQAQLCPRDHTDFMFAAVGEQYGFLGAALVLCLYALLIWRTCAS